MALSLMWRHAISWQHTGLHVTCLIRAWKLVGNHEKPIINYMTLFSELSTRATPEATASIANRTKKPSIQSTDADNHGDLNDFGNLNDAFIEPSRLRKMQAANLKKTRAAIPVPKTGTSIWKTMSKSKHAANVSNTEIRPDWGADEADIFGTIDGARQTQIENLPTLDSGDKTEEEFLSRKPQLWRTAGSFSRQMKALIREQKLGEALNLLEEMTTEARIKPDAYTFNVLIGGCGRAGYTKMAFRLYRMMKDRQLKPDASTYTGLFNACANSPWPEDGLKRASKLYQDISDKGIALNNKNYHAVIKAFGRCGDLQMAFHLVDAMTQNGVAVTCETFNFLLSGCASEKVNGFLLAIRVWKKMREKKIKPDIYSYNLLLRTVCHCNLGDPQIAEKLLLPQLHEQAGGLTEANSDPNNTDTDASSSYDLALTVPQALHFPDLLSPKEKVSSVVALQAAVTPQDRLLMLGGMEGILHRMAKDNVKPQIKTFTELLELIPYNEEAEERLLEAMKEKGVSPDVDFFNVLIKRRNSRNNFGAAKDVLVLIAAHGLHVDIATFGTLALGCEKRDDAKSLLNDMEAAGFRVNIQIMGALVHKACTRRNFWYLIDMLKLIQSEAIPASPKLLTNLESCITSTKKFIVEKEKQGIRFNEEDNFIKSFRAFRTYYKTWLKNMKVQLPDHPWQAYRSTQPTDSDNK